MADVTPLKKNLQVEELKTGAAASESTMQRVASSVNFWNSYYEGSRGWFLNGRYDIISLPQVGVDGAFFAWTNMEIWMIGCYNLVAGSAGSVEFDILKNGSTIFSTKPAIPYTAGANAKLVRDVIANSTVVASPGVTLPALISTQLSAGDMLTCNLTGAQTAGESAGIILGIRPR
jgi:hypothetical protein